jgi:hypothetical protein
MSNITKHLQWEVENMVDTLVELYDLGEPEAATLLINAFNDEGVWDKICNSVIYDLEEKNNKS